MPQGVQLADDHGEGPVDLLIGCDQLYKVVLWDQLEVSPGLRLIETIFGYVLHGQAQREQSGQRHAYRCQLANVERMWTLDAMGVAAEEASARTAPEPTWSEEDNHYQMGLLWKSGRRPVTNLLLAERRICRMSQKLGEEELHRYDEHLKKLKEDGVMPTWRPPARGIGAPLRGRGEVPPHRGPSSEVPATPTRTTTPAARPVPGFRPGGGGAR